MKLFIASALFGATLLSGCTTVVMADSHATRAPVMAEIYHDSQPIVVTEVYHAPVVTYTPAPYCFWQETPVYGYADVYRDGHTHVRIKEVAYVDRQWRCH
jgi:hypothetical protein